MQNQPGILYGIIEDDKEYCSLLSGLLKQRKDATGVIEFHSAEEALKSHQIRSVKMLLIDIQLPKLDGISLMNEPIIRKLKIPKLILTGIHTEKRIFEALKNGAIGYMFKEELDSLNSVIDILISGGAFISSMIAIQITDYFQEMNKSSEKFELLTKREEEILELLTTGYNPQEISETLDTKISTIRTHIRNIYSKLEVNNYNQLIKLSIQNNP